MKAEALEHIEEKSKVNREEILYKKKGIKKESSIKCGRYKGDGNRTIRDEKGEWES